MIFYCFRNFLFAECLHRALDEGIKKNKKFTDGRIGALGKIACFAECLPDPALGKGRGWGTWPISAGWAVQASDSQPAIRAHAGPPPPPDSPPRPRRRTSSPPAPCGTAPLLPTRPRARGHQPAGTRWRSSPARLLPTRRGHQRAPRGGARDCVRPLNGRHATTRLPCSPRGGVARPPTPSTRRRGEAIDRPAGAASSPPPSTVPRPPDPSAAPSPSQRHRLLASIRWCWVGVERSRNWTGLRSNSSHLLFFAGRISKTLHGWIEIEFPVRLRASAVSQITCRGG